MKKQRDRETLYRKSMDSLRGFLDLASYGAYTRDQMKELMDSPATYDKRIGLLSYCLSDKYWDYTASGKERRYSFKADAYHPAENYLYPIFSLKTIDLQQLLADFSLLHCLEEHSEGMSYTKAMNEGTSYPYTFLQQINLAEAQTLSLQLLITHTCEDISNEPKFDSNKWDTEKPETMKKVNEWSWESQYRRRLQDLEDYGFIVRKKAGQFTTYQIAASPLADLSTDELEELRQAVSFYAPISLISLSGYDLYTYHLNPENKPWPDYYQIRNVNNARIANENLIYFFLDCIQEKQPVSFDFHKMKKKCLPMKLDFDEYHREYVAIRTYDNNLEKCLLHEITKVKTDNPGKTHKVLRKSLPKPKMPKNFITVQIAYSSEKEHEDLLEELNSHVFAVKEHKLDDQHSQCQLLSRDLLSLVPWLRTLLPQVRYVSDTTNGNRIWQHLIGDMQEVLTRYEK